MALTGLEPLLISHFPKKGRPEKRAKVNLIRYADDFCVTGSSKELLEQEVKPLVEQFLRERGLQLSPEKTVMTHIEQGFDFLGQTIRKYQRGKRTKFFITPSKKSVKAFLRKGEEGQVRGVRLLAASSIRIERHTKIRAEANPYDPAWETYFEKRLDVQMVVRLKGKRWLIHLWKEQQGLCPICNQKITKITGWHSHHILWRSKGGSDRAENRVLLHPTCHQQVHSQRLHVEKLRPVTRA